MTHLERLLGIVLTSLAASAASAAPPVPFYAANVTHVDRDQLCHRIQQCWADDQRLRRRPLRPAAVDRRRLPARQCVLPNAGEYKPILHSFRLAGEQRRR